MTTSPDRPPRSWPERAPGPGSALTRRGVLGAGLGAGLGLSAAGLLAGCSDRAATGTGAGAHRSFGPAPSLAPTPGQRVVEHTLVPRPATVDLGGVQVETWAYGDAVPGEMLRATAGDLVRVTVRNELPEDTSVHWHGIRLRNVADGVPGLTQEPIAPGASYVYEFTAPDPGTYFFHPHVGVQIDRGLYAPLIVDDPAEPGDYDLEWMVVLDDWLDGTGRTPDQVFETLTGYPVGMGHDADRGDLPSHDMGGMGGMGSMTEPFGDAGDIDYPHYLINGRIPQAPATFRGRPGQRVRIRLLNAASDRIFAVGLGGHMMTITHSDGFPVVPHEVASFFIGQGERYDVVVQLRDGVFPLVARPFGRPGVARAIVRTASGEVGRDPEFGAMPVQPADVLRPAESALLGPRDADAVQRLTLNGSMDPYRWGINGAAYPANEPLRVGEGQRLQLLLGNMTMMTHPLHLHGHTFALSDTGLRKDTVLLRPMQTRTIELDADNPGDWMVHCHNIYHAEAGMMTELRYV